MWSDQVNWADGRTLLYTRMARTEGKNVQEDVMLYRHVIGRPVSEDAPLLGSLAAAPVVVNKEESAVPGSDIGSAWTIGVIGQARPDSRIALARTTDLVAGRAAWVPIAEYEDRVTRATVHGDTLYYITQRELADGEVRSVDARAPKLSASRWVLGGGGLVLKEIVAARDGLYVTALRPTGSSGLLFLLWRGSAGRGQAAVRRCDRQRVRTGGRRLADRVDRRMAQRHAVSAARWRQGDLGRHRERDGSCRGRPRAADREGRDE